MYVSPGEPKSSPQFGPGSSLQDVLDAPLGDVYFVDGAGGGGGGGGHGDLNIMILNNRSSNRNSSSKNIGMSTWARDSWLRIPSVSSFPAWFSSLLGLVLAFCSSDVLIGSRKNQFKGL